MLALCPYHQSHRRIRDDSKRPDAVPCQPSINAYATKHPGIVLLHINMSHITPQRSITQISPIVCTYSEEEDDTRAWHEEPVNRPMISQDPTRRNSEREFACNLPDRAIAASAANYSKA
jgi:hypothetical protein